jgi:hypothetical protein
MAEFKEVKQCSILDKLTTGKQVIAFSAKDLCIKVKNNKTNSK